MNSAYDLIVFTLVASLCVLGAVALLPRTWPRAFRQIVLWAVVARIVGSTARLWVITGYYGRGDALRYYDVGLGIAADLRDGNVAVLWEAKQLWGTQFIERVSGLLLFVTGPGLRAEFLVFSMLPLVGLILIVLTFIRAFPGRVDGRDVALLVLLFPSLVFWPSSVGKEALIVFAIGLVVYGYWGNGHGPRWLVLGAGVALCLGIRPHIAMMVSVALGAAEWLMPTQAWTWKRVLRGLVLAALAAYTVRGAIAQFGLEASLESVSTFAEYRSEKTAQGGSKIGQVSGPLMVPMAVVNVTMRPFPWEVRNPMMVFSAVEVLLFWAMVWRRRDAMRLLVRHWRKSRLLLFVVPLTAVLIFFYGGFVANLGILARQRVIVLPFLFLLVEAAPAFLPRVASRKQTMAPAVRRQAATLHRPPLPPPHIAPMAR